MDQDINFSEDISELGLTVHFASMRGELNGSVTTTACLFSSKGDKALLLGSKDGVLVASTDENKPGKPISPDTLIKMISEFFVSIKEKK